MASDAYGHWIIGGLRGLQSVYKWEDLLMVPKRMAMEIFEYRTFTGHWGIDLGFTRAVQIVAISTRCFSLLLHPAKTYTSHTYPRALYHFIFPLLSSERDPSRSHDQPKPLVQSWIYCAASCRVEVESSSR
jgi:hypothetical protein